MIGLGLYLKNRPVLQFLSPCSHHPVRSVIRQVIKRIFVGLICVIVFYSHPVAILNGFLGDDAGLAVNAAGLEFGDRQLRLRGCCGR